MSPKKEKGEQPSKWQLASVNIVKLRYMLEETLDKDFSEEEKQSEKYKELLTTVKEQFDHYFESRHFKEHKIFNKRNIFITILSAIGGILVSNIEKIFDLIKEIIQRF